MRDTGSSTYPSHPIIARIAPTRYLRRIAAVVFGGVAVLILGFAIYGIAVLGYGPAERYIITTAVQFGVSAACFALALARRVVASIRAFTALMFTVMVIEPLVVTPATLGFTVLLIAPALISLLVAMGLVFRRRVILGATVAAAIIIVFTFIVRPDPGAAVEIELVTVGPLLVITTVAAGLGVMVWGDVVARLLRQADASEKKARELARAREALVRESNHRVKNNLQVISSMLSLQLGDARDEETRATLMDARNRIGALALVHQSLQEDTHPDTVPAQSFLQEMVENIVGGVGPADGSIQARIDAHEVELPAALLVPVGLIVNELTTNALVHGFAGRSDGSIAVALERAPDGGLNLTVHDDGTGFPGTTEDAVSTSLGLTLVRTIATDQLSATFDLATGEGTTARLHIPPASGSPETASPQKGHGGAHTRADARAAAHTQATERSSSST